MTLTIACLVCAPPLDSLLTGGLISGVAVMALVVSGVLVAIAVGARRVWRADAAAERRFVGGGDRT